MEILSGLEELPARLEAMGVRRVLVITTPSRRFLDRLPLEGFTVEVFDGAAVHVPRAVVDAASAALAASAADTVLSLGGGAATGLGKALRLTHDVRFVAVPTTYSGSEMTRIYGIRDGADKRTGRDERARPDLVVHAPELFLDMPRALTTTSLLNALAHPIAALSGARLEDAERAVARRAIEELAWAVEQLLGAGRSRDARRGALEGAARAAEVLDRASERAADLGPHHRVAHRLGGRFGLSHAGLHAALLPHTVRRLAETDPPLHATIAEAVGHPDPAAVLYDALSRAGAARSLAELGVEHDALAALAAEDPSVGEPWVRDAQLGRRPSIHTRRWDAGERPPTSVRGPALADAARVLIAIHGRGANADRMLVDALDLVGHDPGTAVVAPQAPANAWYPGSYRAPLAEHGRDLTEALGALDAVLAQVLAEAPASKVHLVGFSQGACLAAELFARTDAPLAGLVAIAGARIGEPYEQPAPRRDLGGARVVLGVADEDRFVRVADVQRDARRFEGAGADVRVLCAPGDAHELTLRQRLAAREALGGPATERGLGGFGNAHESEALPGALPRHQNSPRHVPYGLYAEQVNATGFTARRRENRRAWLYRVRPSAAPRPFTPLAHPTLIDDWDESPPEPNLVGYRPLPAPSAPTDFVEGLATLGGAGHPRLRRGYAVHLYVANRSMEHRAFYDADGDLLLIPQEGALTLQTELGVLALAPGQIALLPRGLKVSVHLHERFARGYVAEVYGRHFELPERGPVGSNGLADRRHFRAPRARFEDRIDPGYRLTVKQGNALFEAPRDHSPHDVVAWHGDYAPYVYDLDDFCPSGNTRFDHGDPSIHTVIGAPLDEAGASTIDLVFFPPRWDPSEHTFRPPFFHRNVTTELNGIITDPSLSADGPFQPGGCFLTPSLSAHGVLARSVARELARPDTGRDRPARTGDGSRWFQLESALPLGLTSWARASASRVEDWPSIWGAHPSRFDPSAR